MVEQTTSTRDGERRIAMMGDADRLRKNGPPTPSNESQPVTLMPPAVREQVVDLLAQILVADYELFQGVTEPIVHSPTAFNRKLTLVKPRQ
jgi:hypothetical protein